MQVNNLSDTRDTTSRVMHSLPSNRRWTPNVTTSCCIAQDLKLCLPHGQVDHDFFTAASDAGHTQLANQALNQLTFA